MIGKRFSRRPSAFEGLDDGRRRRALRRQLILSRVGLDVLQLHLQLVDEPFLAFRARAVERAPQLLDLQPQPRDQRLGAEGGCLSVGQVGVSTRRAHFALLSRRPLGEDQRMRGGEIGRQRIKCIRHL